jgi:hypothetical protein
LALCAWHSALVCVYAWTEVPTDLALSYPIEVSVTLSAPSVLRAASFSMAGTMGPGRRPGHHQGTEDAPAFHFFKEGKLSRII